MGDNKLSMIPAPVLVDGADVYYLLSATRTDGAAIAATYNRTFSISPPVVAFLARQADEETISLTRSTLDAFQLRAIASATEQILIGAYDGESFLRWRRRTIERL